MKRRVNPEAVAAFPSSACCSSWACWPASACSAAQAFPTLHRIPGHRSRRRKGQGRHHGGRGPADLRQGAPTIDDIKSVTGKDLDVTKDGDKVVVKFAYNREIHLFGPAFLLLKYAGPVQVADRQPRQAWTASSAALQARLQHRFSDPQLLARALTHRSFSADHNERLEFLGDSVLNLAVAALLYDRLQRPARRRPVPGAGQPGQAGHAAPAGRRAWACPMSAAGRGRGALRRHRTGPRSWPTRWKR